MLYSNLLTLNLLVFNELYFCHVLNIILYKPKIIRFKYEE
jgi:hypothetical protein